MTIIQKSVNLMNKLVNDEKVMFKRLLSMNAAEKSLNINFQAVNNLNVCY